MSTQESQAPSGRNVALDGLRFLAILFVVSIHTIGNVLADGGVGPAFLGALNGWAVPFLFVAAGYLWGSRPNGRSWNWAKRRTRRILIPFAAWSFFYVLLTYAWHWKSGTPAPSIDWLSVVFFGTGYYTLWFLPMMLYCGLLALLPRTPRQMNWLVVACAVGAVARSTLLYRDIIHSTDLVPLFFAGLPLYLLLYLAGAQIGRVRLVIPRMSRLTFQLLLIAAFLIAGTVSAISVGNTGLRLGLVTEWVLDGVAVLLVHEAAHGGLGRLVSRWSPGAPYVLGIYLIHPLWIAILVQLVPPTTGPWYLWYPAAYVVVLALSVAATWLLLRNRRLRTLVT